MTLPAWNKYPESPAPPMPSKPQAKAMHATGFAGLHHPSLP